LARLLVEEGHMKTWIYPSKNAWKGSSHARFQAMPRFGYQMAASLGLRADRVHVELDIRSSSILGN